MESEYTMLRPDAAELLDISVRTLDRYIKNGRVRTRRQGKHLYLNRQDITILKQGGIQEPVSVLSTHEAKKEGAPESGVSSEHSTGDYAIATLSPEAIAMIAQKDTLLKELAYRVGVLETELKNSIPLIEHRRATFLLEGARRENETEHNRLMQESQQLKQEVMTTRLWQMVLVSALSVAVIALLVLSFVRL